MIGFWIPRAGAHNNPDSTAVIPHIRKSPRTALIRSALFPGWGQWYNGQKIKAILVLGGEATLIGYSIFYHNKAARSTEAYQRDYYEYNGNRFIWWLAGLHVLSILDAYVDAHLWDFDVGPDLSIRHGWGESGENIVAVRIAFDLDGL